MDNEIVNWNRKRSIPLRIEACLKLRLNTSLAGDVHSPNPQVLLLHLGVYPSALIEVLSDKIWLSMLVSLAFLN